MTIHEGFPRIVEGFAQLAAGRTGPAREAFEHAATLLESSGAVAALMIGPWVEAELVDHETAQARARADAGIETARRLRLRFQLSSILRARARVALVDTDLDHADLAAREALAIASEIGDKLGCADALEILAEIGRDAGAARLLGAADAAQTRLGAVRFAACSNRYQSSVAAVRAALAHDEFERAWAEGAEMSLDEAVAFAQRGRGERKRPSTGWASLTPTELDVVRLVADGLANKEIAEKLFVSPRTVQAHLTHVYRKLGTSSRVQVAKEAAARA
jgi:DNA-binding CsgD family transcriptional regulator